MTVNPEDAKDMFYQDPDDETAKELANDLRPQSWGAFWCKTNYAAWRHIPTPYLLCTADKPSTVIAARYLISTAKASGPHKVDNVIEVDSGHSPFISKPEWTAITLMDETSRKS